MSVVRGQDPLQAQEVGGHAVAEKLSLSSAETVFDEKGSSRSTLLVAL